MPENAIQHSHIYSTYFAPRGRSRIFNLGIQLAQLYLSPFDQIIGVIGEAGSGKSVLIKGMFPGIATGIPPRKAPTAFPRLKAP